MVAYRAKFGSSASNGVSVRPEWIKISAQRPAPWVDGGIDSYKPVAVLAIKNLVVFAAKLLRPSSLLITDET